jgi:hypothetical protein
MCDGVEYKQISRNQPLVTGYKMGVKIIALSGASTILSRLKSSKPPLVCGKAVLWAMRTC